MDESNEEKKPEGEEKDITLTITISGKTGGMAVLAPGDGKMFDEPMCFWLLERAKDHIKLSNASAMKSNIITPKNQQPFYRNIPKRK